MKSNRRQGLTEATREIRNANSILLACHVRPDADALGSLVGLLLGLEQLGKSVQAISPDGVPEIYRFLPGWDRVRTTPEGRWDLGIGLDSDGSDRMGSAEQAVIGSPVTIDIDHHTGPDPFGQVQLVDPTAAATGELVYDLLVELGVAVTPDIAWCLLAAVMTDTGSFRFSSVTPDTFRIAGALVEAGAHPDRIYDVVYGTRAFAASRLLGHLLSSLQRSEDGRVVWASLAQEDFIRLGLGTDATEGFVEQLRMVEGTEIGIFFREERDGEIRVSLRSRNGANVARVAADFGGGGHVAAAGCTLPPPIETAVRQVVEAAERHLRDDDTVI